MPAIGPAIMRPPETREPVPELRRYSRQTRATPVVLETRHGWLRLPLIDLSPGGAKVRLTDPLKEGAPGRLYFLAPLGAPRAIEVIVWRMDLDGAVLLFPGVSITPPAASRDLPPPASWLWTWEARAPPEKANGEASSGPMPDVLNALVAFVAEHQRCGDLDGGRDGGCIWLTCTCGAEIVHLASAPPSAAAADDSRK